MSVIIEPCGCTWYIEPLLEYLKDPANFKESKHCAKHTIGTPECKADTSWQDDPWCPRIITKAH